MAEWIERKEYNFQRINNAKSFDEAIKIAIEDGEIDEEELTAISEKYWDKSKDLYQLYIKQFCDTKTQTECNLNNLQLEIKLRQLAKVTPRILFENLDSFINQPWVKDILLEAVKNAPLLAFDYYNEYKSKPWAKDILLEATKYSPYLAFMYYDKHKTEPWAKNILLVEAAKKDPFLAFERYDEYKTEPWVKIVWLILENKDFLIEVAKYDLRSYFRYYYVYNSEPWAKDILLEIVKDNPFSVFDYYDIYKSEPWAKEIIKLAIQEINNQQEKDYLKIAYIINILHNEDDKLRFAIIDGYSSAELYKVITKWREEVFTSTYNWIITRFLQELNKTWKEVYDVALENNFENISVFLEAAASYDRIEEIFNTIKSDEKKKELINHMFDNLWKDIVRNSVAIMEIINALKDKKVIDFILSKLEIEYNKWWENKNSIWIIAKFASQKYKTPFLDNLPKEYELPKINWVQNKELFDDKWRNIQQYYFYNDEDWKNSFKSFIDKYKSDKKWKIDEKETYVKITSINSKWRQIIIYANKPEFDWSDDKKWNWIESISNEMKRNNQTPTLVVHRGHSYHASKTIEKLTPENKLVFLWSCWWFQNIWATLEKSQKAQIISTKWTWTMLVNDPLFKHINDDILEWRDINWEKIWADISKQVWKNPNFEKYVRPDQNIWALFYNKYNELQSKTSKE